MKATLKSFSREGMWLHVTVIAPPEWWEMVRDGHVLPLELPAMPINKLEMVEVAVEDTRRNEKG